MKRSKRVKKKIFCAADFFEKIHCLKRERCAMLSGALSAVSVTVFLEKVFGEQCHVELHSEFHIRFQNGCVYVVQVY